MPDQIMMAPLMLVILLLGSPPPPEVPVSPEAPTDVAAQATPQAHADSGPEMRAQTNRDASPGAPPVAAVAPKSLEIRVTAGVYLPRLVGTTKLGPSPGAQTLDFCCDIDLNEKKPIANIEVALVKNDLWELQFNGFEYDTSRTAVFDRTSDYGSLSLSPGDLYHASFRMGSFATELSRRQWRFYKDDPDVDLFFSPTLGARLYDIDQTVELIGGGAEDVHRDYTNIYAGLQMDMRWQARQVLGWLERLELEAGAFVGPVLGADSGYGWAIRANISFFFTQDLSAFFGYRLYELNITDGDYELDGGLQGIFIGGTIRF